MQNNILSIENLNKTYEGGFKALKNIQLEIKKGEIFALLGPNGAGKTTLISTICGLVSPTSGSIRVNGHDIIKNYRQARELIGLVPQEITVHAFETVQYTVEFTRGLFGKPKNSEKIESILKELTLWEKRKSKSMTLSGGMKRRLMIAKALSHEPQILFLDEPSAGVDVSLRKEMWRLVHRLRDQGVTIILTTHYIEEAEEMADRIGVINHGEIILVEDKNTLMKKLGKKQLTLELETPLKQVPPALSNFNLKIDQSKLIYTYDANQEDNGISTLLETLKLQDVKYQDIVTKQSSLEDIFVELVRPV